MCLIALLQQMWYASQTDNPPFYGGLNLMNIWIGIVLLITSIILHLVCGNVFVIYLNPWQYWPHFIRPRFWHFTCDSLKCHSLHSIVTCTDFRLSLKSVQYNFRQIFEIVFSHCMLLGIRSRNPFVYRCRLSARSFFFCRGIFTCYLFQYTVGPQAVTGMGYSCNHKYKYQSLIQH